MEVTTEMLIDTALNVAGFITAGVLLLVIQSMFRRRPRAKQPDEAATEQTPVAEQTAGPGSSAKREARSVQFVGFGSKETDDGGNARRNRAEVLRMARSMIQTGATSAEIKATLPVSDAELAVLNYERK